MKPLKDGLRRAKPWPMLVIASFVLLNSSYSLGQSIEFTTDFENGTLPGWEKTGTAFDFQPTLGDNPTARKRGQPANHQGKYWIGTYERYQGRPGQKPGDIQGDKPQGTLTSAPFTIPEGTLSFLVGGGSSLQTRVELLRIDPIEGRIPVYRATGRNTETMQRESWDLTPYAGQTGQIRIVDESSEGWGHINADNFIFAPAIALKAIQQMPIVPDVVGRNVKEAADILRENRLRLGRVDRRPSDQKAGTVMNQDPPEGTMVRIDTPVNLIVAAEGGVKVPDVTGRHINEAEAALIESRLILGRVDREPSDQKVNTVIEQSPVAGTAVQVGAPVNLVVAAAGRVEVPNVVGLHIKEAEDVLPKSRLKLGRVDRRASDLKVDTVLDQNPEPGSVVQIGSPVDLTVAAVQLVEVPSLIGMHIGQAEGVLKESRLGLGKVEREPSDQEVETVLWQRPETGTRVEIGTPVNLKVAAVRLVEVPNLVGLHRDQAEGVLKDARLKLGRVDERPSTERTSTILEQNPDAGSRVQADSAVNIMVAALELIEVPSVVGLNRDQAVEVLQEAGLAVGRLDEEPSHQGVNTVLGQSLEAGTMVRVGAVVNLIVAVLERVEVPDVVGLHKDHAIEVLRGALLQLGRVDEESSEQDGGTVLEQSPESRSLVRIGSPVHLIVARRAMIIPWVGILGGLLVIVGGCGLLARIKRRATRPGSAGAAIHVNLHRDLGHQEVDSHAPIQSDLELRLRPVIDKGDQDIKVGDLLRRDDRRNHE
jgi:beta-lactam-binding protein with PASTA domain